MSDDMVKYYRDRAKEYEEIYEWRDPQRQEEQDLMGRELKKVFRGRDVLDIGCGTGYWTERISETADRVTGIDVNDAVLEIARFKEYGCPAGFKVMDAYNLDIPPDTFTGAIASFWLSHVPRERLDAWIDHMHGVLAPGARVFIADNTYIEGVGGKLVTKEGDANTYKLRTLNDGTQHLIVKNYFTAAELVDLFGRHTEGVTEADVFHGRCFWWISYTLKK
ncbi:class I SAM-dependent methyltransferase [Candidatus Bathyarchaeota archaeon]|nr:class I SAM-dependent methyltransferase [Candidatus Bathyarchaeota archaeon]